MKYPTVSSFFIEMCAQSQANPIGEVAQILALPLRELELAAWLRIRYEFPSGSYIALLILPLVTSILVLLES